MSLYMSHKMEPILKQLPLENYMLGKSLHRGPGMQSSGNMSKIHSWELIRSSIALFASMQLFPISICEIRLQLGDLIRQMVFGNVQKQPNIAGATHSSICASCLLLSITSIFS